jgi:FixJ family two-component response regulator
MTNIEKSVALFDEETYLRKIGAQREADASAEKLRSLLKTLTPEERENFWRQVAGANA